MHLTNFIGNNKKKLTNILAAMSAPVPMKISNKIETLPSPELQYVVLNVMCALVLMKIGNKIETPLSLVTICNFECDVFTCFDEN